MTKSLMHVGGDFEAFYSRNYKLVYRVCFTYMKNSFEAEDCTEETFLKVLAGKYTERGEAHEKAWLSVTAINLCKDRLKHWWHKKTMPLDSCAEAAEAAFEIDETLDAVMELPAKYKDVIYLYYCMGYPTAQIATMLGKPASTVRNHLREARLLLRERLGDDWYEG